MKAKVFKYKSDGNTVVASYMGTGAVCEECISLPVKKERRRE